MKIRMSRISVRVQYLITNLIARTRGVVIRYRQQPIFHFIFLTMVPIFVVSGLLFIIVAATKNPTPLLSAEVGAASSAADMPVKSPGRLNTNHLTANTAVPTLDTSGTSTGNAWDYNHAAESIQRIDDESVTIESFSTHELSPGEKTTILYFDGRPVRPVRTMTMTVTAYSPDARSCAPFDDGITASGYSVWTNGMKLIAADKSLPFGTLLSVPGYNGSRPTPVLDRGAAIKGNRLDLLYPTHEIARQWGRQKLTVTVWEYAD